MENELKGGFFSNEICGCCTVEDEYEQLTLLKESLPVNEEEAMMSRVIEDSDSVGSDESDEFDYLLEEEDSSSLTRKSEMLAEAALHEKIGRHGFGRFLNVRDLKKFKFEGVSLIHVYTNNIESARMDVHLETFCGKWKGTRFLRIRKGR